MAKCNRCLQYGDCVATETIIETTELSVLAWLFIDGRIQVVFDSLHTLLELNDATAHLTHHARQPVAEEEDGDSRHNQKLDVAWHSKETDQNCIRDHHGYALALRGGMLGTSTQPNGESGKLPCKGVSRTNVRAVCTSAQTSPMVALNSNATASLVKHKWSITDNMTSLLSHLIADVCEV